VSQNDHGEIRGNIRCRNILVYVMLSQNDHGEIRGNIRCRNILVYVMLSQNDHGEIHGNIRCRNILVYCHERRTFRVKLADVGLVHYYNSLLRDDRVNLDR